MRRISLLIATAAIVGSTGVAFADHQAGHSTVLGSNGYSGGCLLDFGGMQITIGEMMQTLRARTDAISGNPKQIVDAYSGANWGNVGGLISDKCGDPS